MQNQNVLVIRSALPRQTIPNDDAILHEPAPPVKPYFCEMV